MLTMKNKERGIGGGSSSSSVVLRSYLKKVKTNRKKYFVLRAETSETSARLEYYDSERKFNNGQPPKRCIPLKNCFNINRKVDNKHKHVISLYTKDDCFCIALDSEEDVETWLTALLKLQHGGEEVVDGETPKPTFEHVWQVNVLNRGMGGGYISGSCRLCLTAKNLMVYRKDSDVPCVNVSLSHVRSSGHLRDFIFIEFGRASSVGAKELWLQTEDHHIAANVFTTLYHTTNMNKQRVEMEEMGLGPKSRTRSSSATESSKPNSMLRKIHSSIPPKFHVFTQDLSHSTDTQVSMGSSSQHPIAGNVTQCGTISHQRTQSLPLANPAPISDQNTTTSHPLRVAKRSNQSSKCTSGGRERCDSMPSRTRTTSEGTHPMQMWNQTRSHLIPYRPASLYGRDVSHSPPTGSPVSPPSVGCSTDSAGSSYSLADEPDVCAEMEPTLGRYGHSLTPDEAIAEEECPDSPPYAPNNYVSMGTHGSDDGYVDMSPRGRHHNHSPTASTSSVTSGTPSTDMRFAEYPLEKVSSYFTCGDDDARPARAYSVGSKPDSYKKLEVLGQNGENLRVRALSVGSKAKKAMGRVLPPHGYHAHQGAKSSSAPILSSGRGQGSHNSIGPMDDLMEMDFSRSGSVNDSSYMDMRPGPKDHHHGYVEMKPGRKPDTSPYVDMSQGSSPAKPSFIPPQTDGPNDAGAGASGDYMKMDPNKNSTNQNHNDDYLTMSFKRPASNYQLSPARASPLVGGGYLDSHFGSPKTEPATPDGYVEMSLGRGHQRQSSLDGAPQTANEDYANVSSMGKKRDRGARKKEKAKSQPIAIQNPGGNASRAGGSSSSPRYSLMGRKFSTGTPPMHLSLNEATPYSSLPRQRRRDSKDSSSSSVTTPSSSSTIFPISLNSPCSPVKPDRTPPKKTESDYTPMDFDSGRSSDYVNFNPKTPVNSEDYAVMKPGVGVRVSSPSMRMTMMQLSDSASFRPINENKDEAPQEKPEESRTEPAYEVLRARPASVAESGRSSLSRPSSTSSELCSSGSTIVGGSRPESVNSDRVRPASVTSADVQLHYASLDLEEGNRSPRTVKTEGQGGTEVTLTYAAIDFVKSEGLKHNTLQTNAKVKH